MYIYIYVLHYLNDPRLWELWYIRYYWECRNNVNRMRVPSTVVERFLWWGSYG